MRGTYFLGILNFLHKGGVFLDTQDVECLCLHVDGINEVIVRCGVLRATACHATPMLQCGVLQHVARCPASCIGTAWAVLRSWYLPNEPVTYKTDDWSHAQNVTCHPSHVTKMHASRSLSIRDKCMTRQYGDCCLFTYVYLTEPRMTDHLLMCT